MELGAPNECAATHRVNVLQVWLEPLCRMGMGLTGGGRGDSPRSLRALEPVKPFLMYPDVQSLFKCMCFAWVQAPALGTLAACWTALWRASRTTRQHLHRPRTCPRRASRTHPCQPHRQPGPQPSRPPVLTKRSKKCQSSQWHGACQVRAEGNQKGMVPITLCTT